MKCSNPDCKRGLGLVSYQRGRFGKRRYCSKHCRDAAVAHDPKLQQRQNATTYFEWLFLQPIEKPQLQLKPALIRTKAR
jgi:hypothetical protein